MVVDDSPTATPVDISTSHVVDAEEDVENPSYCDVTTPTIDNGETYVNEDEARMSPSMGNVGVSLSKYEAGVNPRMGEGGVSPSKYEVGAIPTSGEVGGIPGTTKVGASDNIVKDKFSDNVGLDDKLGKLSQRTDREVEIMLLDFVDAPAEY
uniref:Uncharacterized protein n=1 Tax=Ciona savignyi TaxID=51511 RepID=H2YN07_CIOSA